MGVFDQPVSNPILDAKRERQKTHGWFHTEQRPGDRSLYQQMMGLGPLLDEVKGKTLLDVGTAEGLIAIEMAKHGAISVLGIELVPGHLDIAHQLKGDLPCEFLEADANDYTPEQQYDIVLLLGILHKLKNPSDACETLANAASQLCVVRFPSASARSIIIDERSGKEPHDIAAVMDSLGFLLEREELGPFLEPTKYWRRTSGPR